MSTKKIHITLLDDHPIILAGIKSILDDQNEFHVVIEANTIDVLMQNNQYDTDIILLNQEQFEDTLADEIESLTSTFPNAKLALFVSDSEKLNISEVLQSNVLGLLAKDMNANLLISALKTILQNKYWLSPDTMNRFIDIYKQNITDNILSPVRPIDTPPKHLISPREYDVLKLLAKGFDNKEIAISLNINASTVKNHIANMFEKNEVKARTPLVLKALRNNWLRLGCEQDEEEPKKISEC